MEKCILSDPSIGIITENDHKLGLCLCYKCTCGQHICATRSLFSRRSLRSQASSKAFNAKTPFKSLVSNDPLLNPFKITHRKFNSQSTYQNDFIPHSQTSESESYPRKTSQNFRFLTGKTMYQAEFVEKITEPVQNFAPVVTCVYPNGIKLDDSTTYNLSFDSKVQKHSNLKRRRYKSTPKLRIFSGLVCYNESTHKRDFKPEKVVRIQRAAIQDRKIELRSVSQLQSTSQKDFQLRVNSSKEIRRRLCCRNFNN